MRSRIAIIIGLSLLVGLGVGRATADLEWPQPDRPNIVLVTVDTLRADHLPFYGYHRDTAPFLESLAAEGVVFDYATSTSSWTSPSVASLITSLYPHQHGVETTASEDDHGSFSQAAISHDITTTAENLKRLGYDTFGVVTNLHIGHDIGFAQGFDHFENVGFSKSGEPIYNGVLSLTNRLLDADPYFLWIHLFDPHAPYRKVEPYVTQFDEESATRFPLIAAQEPKERSRRLGRWANRQVDSIEKESASATNPIVIETLRTLYDAELRDTDEWIKRCIQALKLDRDAVLMFTADHGEEFREHGRLGHRNTLHGELTRVPMMIWSPRRIRNGARVADATSLVDVLPTLVDAAGGAPPEGIQGKSLWQAARTGAPLPPRDLLLGVHNPNGDTRGIVRYPLKLIEAPDGGVTLYDLASDPGEQADVATARASDAVELRDALRAAFAGLPVVAQERTQVEASQVEMLHELGYFEADDEAAAEP